MIPFPFSIPLTALVVVFFLIAIRQIGSLRVQIWQAMLGGALAVNLAGELTVEKALASVKGILGFSVLFSQAISNVPLVALSLPLLREVTAGATAYMALAAGSTIAGNLFVLGAASNVIVIQNAEKRGTTGISFLGFARVGILLDNHAGCGVLAFPPARFSVVPADLACPRVGGGTAGGRHCLSAGWVVSWSDCSNRS